jgi:hypothetical protein
MALPSSGQISISQVSVELGRASTATTSLGETAVRTLAGVPSGAISMSNLWGKGSEWSATITSNQENLNLRTWAIANGWDQSSKAVITVNTGIYIWCSADVLVYNGSAWVETNTPAMAITGTWPGGLTIINKGFIMGKGGDGSFSRIWKNTPPLGGEPGGPAISTSVNLIIDNTYASAYIGGGGGAGLAGASYSSGGGGAGGGRGELTDGRQSIGYGGAIGQSGTNGGLYNTSSAGGGGGRVFPGVGGASVTGLTGGRGGTGGGGGSSTGNAGATYSGAGGSGSSNGGNPGASGKGFGSGGGGGGWGATGGGPGKVGGKAVMLNGNSVTWVSGDTTRVWGAVS